MHQSSASLHDHLDRKLLVTYGTDMVTAEENSSSTKAPIGPIRQHSIHSYSSLQLYSHNQKSNMPDSHLASGLAILINRIISPTPAFPLMLGPSFRSLALRFTCAAFDAFSDFSKPSTSILFSPVTVGVWLASGCFLKSLNGFVVLKYRRIPLGACCGGKKLDFGNVVTVRCSGACGRRVEKL